MKRLLDILWGIIRAFIVLVLGILAVVGAVIAILVMAIFNPKARDAIFAHQDLRLEAE